jgi:hypothetical protein
MEVERCIAIQNQFGRGQDALTALGGGFVGLEDVLGVTGEGEI